MVFFALPELLRECNLQYATVTFFHIPFNSSFTVIQAYLFDTTRMYPKVSGLAAWRGNCKCVASQRVFIVVSVISLSTQSGNFWMHSRVCVCVCVREREREKLGQDRGQWWGNVSTVMGLQAP